MTNPFARRDFLKTSGALATLAAVGGTVSACGGSDDGPAPMSTSDQLAMTSTQAVASIRAGSVTAQA